MVAPSAGGYVDFARFSGLRAAASGDGRAALTAVADEFEALFVDLMLKAAREATPGDGLFDSQAGDTYREMFDQQIALGLARDHDFGIGAALERQFAAHLPAAGVAPDEAVPSRTAQAVASGSGPGISETRAAGHAADTSRAAFVKRVAPHAADAARRLGVSPRALVAQAALETGWGKHVMRDEFGASTHNYFGIKAGSDWSGATVTVATTEYVDGRAVTVREPFRAYPDEAAAFEDYARLIAGSSRYARARAAGHDAAGYAHGLSSGGYASDPHYAEKIINIVERQDWSLPAAAGITHNRGS